jgi:hypothetical protein
MSQPFRFGQWPDSWVLSRRAQEFSGIECSAINKSEIRRHDDLPKVVNDGDDETSVFCSVVDKKAPPSRPIRAP